MLFSEKVQLQGESQKIFKQYILIYIYTEIYIHTYIYTHIYIYAHIYIHTCFR